MKLKSAGMVGESGEASISFGDMVVLCDGSLAVVYAVPDSQRHLRCLALDDLGNLALRCELPEIVLAERSDVRRVVASREDLAPEIQRALQRAEL